MDSVGCKTANEFFFRIFMFRLVVCFTYNPIAVGGTHIISINK